MYKYPEIAENLIHMALEVLDNLRDVFNEIDEICEENQYKVLSAFKKNKVGFNHLSYSATGYGYDDGGRDKLEDVYADVFNCEAALVRAQITCGTQAIFLALDANLLPEDELLYITGMPYDSLMPSIGTPDKPEENSLAEKGVSFKYVDLIENKYFNFPKIKEVINDKTKVIGIQRSKGYSNRASLSSEYIGEAIKFIKETRNDIIVMVDNCYGEFVESKEPTDFGADLCVGSLIKNPGGGLAPFGGYIAGKEALIERCAKRLTAPGLGREVGSSLGVIKSFFQGLALAPKVTSEALKNACFAAAMFERFGFNTHPKPSEKRYDIVQAIDMTSPEKLKIFCEEIQKASYIDSFVSPIDWDMPGYKDKIIMASGSFTSGSSIELSADGPMRPPYTAYFQGGLTHEQGRYAVLSALSKLLDYK